MYSAGELERASMALDKPMKELEERIMADIVRRIREAGEITSSADWQINRAVQLGMSMDDVTAYINEALSEGENITDTLYNDVIKAGYVRDKKLYEAAGKIQIPFDKNLPLQQLISGVTAQTNETLVNITQSLGFAKRGIDGKIQFIVLAKYYQQTLDKAVLDISSGAFDYNTVLKRTVSELTNSGLRTIDYATGWSNRVNVAARRAVMTGMTQLTGKVNEDNAEQLDTEWFEISWHSGARPSHWWGGKWYKKEQLVSICGLGEVTGLCGANCYHSYTPVIPGISEPTYSTEELAELEKREKEPVEWGSKKYTKYEATQRQRQLETAMRAQREEMMLLKEGGASEDDLINCRARYMVTSHQYTQFSKAMGLPQQRERVSIDGLGNIMQGNTKGGSGAPSPIKVPAVGAKVVDKITAEERKELLSRNKVDIDNKPTKQLSVYEEHTQNQEKIKATLHDVEEKRRSLDYEVGTIIDRNGNILDVIQGEQHQVSVEDGVLNDLIFTHNHPSGGCFSDGDIHNMITDNLLELRASTPQGTYYSLVRTAKADKNSKFEYEFKKANSIVTATKQVQEDLKKGLITKQEIKDKGFNLYIEYMSKSAEKFLEVNAEKYGYIFTKGVI